MRCGQCACFSPNMREIFHSTNKQHSPTTLRQASLSAQGTSVLLRSARRGFQLTANGKATISFSSPLTAGETYSRSPITTAGLRVHHQRGRQAPPGIPAAERNPVLAGPDSTRPDTDPVAEMTTGRETTAIPYHVLGRIHRLAGGPLPRTSMYGTPFLFSGALQLRYN